MAWTLCSSAAAIAKAGVGVDPSIVASWAILDQWSDEVEGVVMMKTRKDWVAEIGSVTAIASGALHDLCSDLIAIKMVNYSHRGYLKKESQTILDVLKDNSDNVIKDLREKQYQEPID